MKPAWHAEAQRLRAEGMTYAAIGREMGYTPSAVRMACNPDIAAERARIDNSRPGRNTQKRACDDRARAKCIDCGNDCFAGSAWCDTKRCVPCRTAVLAA